MVFQNPFKETKLIGSDQYIYYIYIYITYQKHIWISYYQMFSIISNLNPMKKLEVSTNITQKTKENHHFELPKSHYPKKLWKLMFSCFDREIHRN
jgi:hypothetical protein